jgi:hypothetical protein
VADLTPPLPGFEPGARKGKPYRTGRKPDMPCSECGRLRYSSLQSKRSGVLTCVDCRRKRAGYRPRRSDWRPVVATCPTCGESFKQQRYGQKYCTTRCRWRRQRRAFSDDAIERRKQYDRARNRNKLHRRRVRDKGVAAESYTLAEIAKRDRYRCGLCRKRVAMTKAMPHPKAPTIDHIVPLAAGGDNTKANVQLAHFRCNSKKNSGGSQQLRLIG